MNKIVTDVVLDTLEEFAREQGAYDPRGMAIQAYGVLVERVLDAANPDTYDRLVSAMAESVPVTEAEDIWGSTPVPDGESVRVALRTIASALGVSL